MKKQLFALLLACVAMTSALAVPARRGFIEKIGPDGQPVAVQLIGDEFGHYWVDADGRTMIDNGERLECASGDLINQITTHRSARFEKRNTTIKARSKKAAAKVPGRIGTFPGTTFPAIGKQKAIVVLVEYKDVKFRIGTDAQAKTYFTNMLNEDGFSQYNGTGSAHEYFIDSSNGLFDCQFDVYGPITLNNNMSYYGGNDSYGNDLRPEEMVIEACQQLDATVDFSEYDRDNDGIIDNVYVIYAGQGEASGGSSNTVWPHSWSIVEGAGKNLEFDGVLLDTYGCSNEWESYTNGGEGGPDGIGTFVHEFSHILGLPDLYHTEDAYATYTPGSWSVLDYGPYNNDGRTPPAYSAFERNAIGWIDLKELTEDAGDVILPELNYSNEALVITNPTNSGEFYLIESRQQKGWDKYLPATGMLIWHVDYNYSSWELNEVNNVKSHQGVDLIEADGLAEKSTRNGGDCFPGTHQVTSYSPKWWNNNSTGIDIDDIELTVDGGVMFTVSENAGSNNNPGGEIGGDYLTVGDILAGEGGSGINVRGYIVGWTSNWSDNGVHFNASGNVLNSNILLADAADETDRDYLIPVKLSNGTDVRKDVNLADNPSNIGRYIEFTGTAGKYFGTIGLIDCTAYRFIDQTQNAIEEVAAPSIPGETEVIYDLQGRRVANPGHGLYIINGRKVRL